MTNGINGVMKDVAHVSKQQLELSAQIIGMILFMDGSIIR